MPPSPGHLTPTTAATYAANYFWPKASGEVANNRLALAGARYSVVTIDVDGAAIKLRQFADNMQYAPVRTGAVPAVAALGRARGCPHRAGVRCSTASSARPRRITLTIVGGGGVTLDAASLLHGLRWQAYDCRERALVLAV